MDYGFILENEKIYNHKESVKLLEEVRDFFQEKMKMIGIEYNSENNKIHSKNIISDKSRLFFIEKGNQSPLYELCNGLDDVEKILNLFNESLNKLLDNFDAVIDNNKNISDDSLQLLESYGSVIDKCINVFNTQRKRRNTKFKQILTVSELREELKRFIGEIISNYIILALIDALYIRIKNNPEEIYTLVINEINRFLSENGIYTKKISVGEIIDPEFVEPTDDSTINFTDDFNKFDTIEEIKRYPYLFSDGYKIVDGSAKIWRRKD